MQIRIGDEPLACPHAMDSFRLRIRWNRHHGGCRCRNSSRPTGSFRYGGGSGGSGSGDDDGTLAACLKNTVLRRQHNHRIHLDRASHHNQITLSFWGHAHSFTSSESIRPFVSSRYANCRRAMVHPLPRSCYPPTAAFEPGPKVLIPGSMFRSPGLRLPARSVRRVRW